MFCYQFRCRTPWGAEAEDGSFPGLVPVHVPAVARGDAQVANDATIATQVRASWPHCVRALLKLILFVSSSLSSRISPLSGIQPTINSLLCRSFLPLLFEMRVLQLISLIPLLTPLAVAGNYPPYQRLFDKLKEYSVSAQNAFEGFKDIVGAGIPDPLDAGASVVAGHVVERINVRNFQRKLAPKLEGEEEWMVYFTGGNKSCFGRCGPVDLIWNVRLHSLSPSVPDPTLLSSTSIDHPLTQTPLQESVPLLATLDTLPSAPKLRLGKVDCEKDHPLCTALSTGLPSVWHFMIPQKTDANSKTPLHIVPLNITTSTVGSITSIPSSSKSRYLEYPEYTGSNHPTDGWLAQYGLLVPMGYAFWLLGSTPSWVMMIVVSFFSRQIMSRRTQPGYSQYQQERPRAASGNMPPPAPRGGSSTGKMVKKNK